METVKPPVEPPINMPTYARLRESIRADIVLGRWKLGQHLVLGELATRYETSRSPVREALFSMYGQGMIDLPANKGAIVLPVDKTYLHHYFPIRHALLALLVEHSCEGRTSDEIVQLRILMQAVESAHADGDADALYQADRAFHDHLDRFGGNPQVVDLLRPRNDMLAAFRTSREAVLPSDHRGWVACCRQIIQALEQRDAPAARIAVQDHAVSLERYMHHLLEVPLRHGGPRSLDAADSPSFGGAAGAAGAAASKRPSPENRVR